MILNSGLPSNYAPTEFDRPTSGLPVDSYDYEPEISAPIVPDAAPDAYVPAQAPAAPVTSILPDVWPFTPQPSLRNPNDPGLIGRMYRPWLQRQNRKPVRRRGRDSRGNDVIVEIEEPESTGLIAGVASAIAENPIKSAAAAGILGYLGWKYSK